MMIITSNLVLKMGGEEKYYNNLKQHNNKTERNLSRNLVLYFEDYLRWSRTLIFFLHVSERVRS